MFTGIIQEVGKIIAYQNYANQSARIYIETSEKFLDGVKLGDSIAHNGGCMTVCEMYNQQSLSELNLDLNLIKNPEINQTLKNTFFCFDVSNESLSKIVDYRKLQYVNLEKSLSLQDVLGGHLVTGHVDCQGQIKHLEKDEHGATLGIFIPWAFAKYMAKKGSVTVNGTSLTINDLKDLKAPENNFEKGCIIDLYLIPHTLENTSLGHLVLDDFVNIEIDLLARYLDRLQMFS